MSRPIDPLRPGVAEPNGEESEHDRDADIGGCGKRTRRLQELERLEAEGGEGGVAAAEPYHDELPAQGGDIDAAVGPRQRREAADDEGPRDVDDDGAPRKARAPEDDGEKTSAVACKTAERAADGDDEIGRHRSH